MNQRSVRAVGEVIYTQAALAAMREAGGTGLSLICRHLTGDRDAGGLIDQDTLISRYRFGDLEIVVTTMFLDTPELRWTEICLSDEVIAEEGAGDDLDLDDPDLMTEVGLAMADSLEAGDLTEKETENDIEPIAEAELAGSDSPASADLPEEAVAEGEAVVQDQIISDEPNKTPVIRQMEEVEASLAQIKPGPFQNRRRFERAAMERLVYSIQSEGLIHPPIVALIEGEYRLLAGERRWRSLCALVLAGEQALSLDSALDLVCQADWPAQLERHYDILDGHQLKVWLEVCGDRQRMHILSVIDNFQSEGLNPIEEAREILSLKTTYGYSDRQVARIVNRGEAHVKGRLRLLDLDKPIQELIAGGRLHRDRCVADALLSIPDAEARIRAARYHAQRNSGIKVIVAACKRLKQKLKEEEQEEQQTNSGAGSPNGTLMVELALNGRALANGQSSRAPGSFRQAAKEMCQQCPAREEHAIQIPEPAWTIVAAEAADICGHCELNGMRRLCALCPGLALVKRIVENHVEYAETEVAR